MGHRAHQLSRPPHEEPTSPRSHNFDAFTLILTNLSIYVTLLCRFQEQTLQLRSDGLCQVMPAQQVSVNS